MRKVHGEASVLWRRFYSGEITAAEYERSYPLPVLIGPAEASNLPHDAPAVFRDRWIANATTVWQPEAKRPRARKAK